MDKRWIFIIIIVICGIGCLYLIADASNTVGTANANVESFIITLPDNFNIKDSDNGMLELINRKTEEDILIACLKDYPIKKISGEVYDEIENNTENTVIKNETFKVGETSYPSVYYENSNKEINRVVFIEKDDCTIVIECKKFSDKSTLDKDVKYVIDSLRPDYKQKKSK